MGDHSDPITTVSLDIIASYTPTTSVEWLVSRAYNNSVDGFTNSTIPQSNDGQQHPGILTEAEWIIVILTPIIVVFGTIGNLMSVTVLLRPKFRSVSINVYLLGLAGADTAFLWTNSMTRSFIKICWGVDLSADTALGCLAYVYVLHVSKCLSAWFVVAVTIERLLVVVFPYTARMYSRYKRRVAIVLLITLSVFAIFAFIPSMHLYDVIWVEKKSAHKCKMRSMWQERQMDVVLKTLDMLLYSLLPTAILTFSNAVLIYKLALSSRFRKANMIHNAEQDLGARRLTITLTLISSCFLVCTVPMSSFLLHAQISTRVVHFDIVYRSLYVLELLNSAINFILYCASGPAFRAEMKLCVVTVCQGCRRLWCRPRVPCNSCTNSEPRSTQESNNTTLSNVNTDLLHSQQNVAKIMVWTTSVATPHENTRL